MELLPVEPGPIRIERFIEKRFGIQVQYEELPQGLLGFTQFGSKGVESIVIARTLDDGSPSSERRVRSTMAHEGGHGLFHTYLMALGTTARPLFGEDLDPKLPRLLCRMDGQNSEKKVGKRYDGRWWEFQANQAMGALLLPRRLVEMSLEKTLVESGSLGVRVLEERRRESAVQLVAETFDVNAVVARIRLSALFPEAVAGQLTL